MEYEIIEVTCVACLQKIEKPSDSDMNSFRLGIPMHIKCLEIHERIEKAMDRIRGIPTYMGPIED